MALYRSSFNKYKILANPTIHIFRRCHASLKDVLCEKVPEQFEIVKAFRMKHGKEVVGKVTINSMYGGMRGVKAMVWETSLLDPDEGIRFRGKTIPELLKVLPKAEGGTQPLPEGLFWLLCTGDIPSKEQVSGLSQELAARAKIPSFIKKMIKNMPVKCPPMAQLSCAVIALNRDSAFAKAYTKKVKRDTYWEYVYEDALDLIAKIPIIAGMIYRHTYKEDDSEVCVDCCKDLSYNLSLALGYCEEDFFEMMRLYMTIHSDHEGGNVSAHAAHLVGSALSDPFLAWGAGLLGLAGPLHGLANQEVLQWILKLRKEVGKTPTNDQIKDFVQKTLKSGNVIPGFGHAVLRKTDPRYTCQREFGLKRFPDFPIFKIVCQLYEVVPPVLKKLGKVKNPWPNVDAISGSLLQNYGLKEAHFYTALFGVSRTIGVMASNIWSRALFFPIERPKSMTSESLMKIYKAKKKDCVC